MKLCILPIFVALFGLVSLTSARVFLFNPDSMIRNNAMGYAAGSPQTRVMEEESFVGGAGENFNPGFGGRVFNNPLRSLTRSFKPQYGSIMEAAEGGYQPGSDAVPWGTY